ncbi:WRKY Transcription Factor [Ancistrocladus abbreviatus]
MEINGCSSSEQVALVSELVKGMELAKQLKAYLAPEFPAEIREMLLEGILSSYDKALFILNCCAATELPQQPVPSSAMPSTPISFTESPRSEDLNVGHQDGRRDFPNKRKSKPTWTEQVKINFENGVEGPPDDGYSWRKYGQKDILGAKYPRSYFRCTYRSVQDCWAIKHVQRSDEDPSIFDITYKGKHTCRLAPRSKSAPASPEKQELKSHHLQIKDYQKEPSIILNFQTGLSVDIPNANNKETSFHSSSTAIGCISADNLNMSPTTINYDNFYSTFSPSFISPATSESNYFSMGKMDSFGGFQHGKHSESDITEIVSATTSGTNSPIVELDFSLDPMHFNPSFPFDNPGFFP